MRSQQEYSAKDLSGAPGKTNIRIIKSPAGRKNSLKRLKKDSLFTLRINERKFKDLLRKSIRTILIEEFRIVSYEDGKQSKDPSLVSNVDFPVLVLNNYRTLTAKEI